MYLFGVCAHLFRLCHGANCKNALHLLHELQKKLWFIAGVGFERTNLHFSFTRHKKRRLNCII